MRIIILLRHVTFNKDSKNCKNVSWQCFTSWILYVNGKYIMYKYSKQGISRLSTYKMQLQSLVAWRKKSTGIVIHRWRKSTWRTRRGKYYNFRENNFDRLGKESRSQDRCIGPIYTSTCLYQYYIRGRAINLASGFSQGWSVRCQSAVSHPIMLFCSPQWKEIRRGGSSIIRESSRYIRL